MDTEQIATRVINTAFHLHRDLGPGLLESVYEAVFAMLLAEDGLRVTRQQPIPICFGGLSIDEGFRADLVVEDALLVELKSVETIHPVHAKQLLTYLRLMKLPLGLLINFGAPTFREGIKRVVNNHHNFMASNLRIHQQAAAPF
jgi:GxxExxY protein